MSSKHYKEQKMIIENFRRWQESDTEEHSEINEGLADISVAGVLWDSVVDMWGFLSSFLGATLIAWRAVGPWMKIISESPRGQAAIRSFPYKGDELLSVIQAADASNVVQSVRAFGEAIKEANKTAYYFGWIVYAIGIVAMFPFNAILGLEVGTRLAAVASSETVRAAGKMSLKARNITNKVQTKIGNLREKYPNAAEEERNKFEEAAAMIEKSLMAAGATVEEAKKILENPELYDKSADKAPSDLEAAAKQLDRPGNQPSLPLSNKDKKSKAQKVDIPKRKDDEDSEENEWDAILGRKT